MRLESIGLILCLCFPLLNSFAQNGERTPKRYDFSAATKTIQEAIAKKEIPSMAVAISKDGRIIYEDAFGYADMEKKVQATVNTAYRLASVSKPITATGLMVLYQKGLVKIDAPAKQYAKPLRFRSFAGNSSDVTLRHLLTHSSGLSSYFRYAFGDDQSAAPNFEAAFDRYGSFFHPAGRLMEYSNLGYGLIGFIIAKQSGESFASFMQTEVFDPLDMRNSFVTKPTNTSIQVAKTYDSDLRVLSELDNNTEGAGNMYSSVHDLMLFSAVDLAMDQGRKPLLSEENIELVRNSGQTSAFNPLFGVSTSYGFGWYMRPDDSGYKTMWHEGGMPGASSFIKLILAEKISVAAITNVADKNELIETVANELVKAILPSYQPEPLNATVGYKPYDGQAEYQGKWTGSIYVQGRRLPCSLAFRRGGELHIIYGNSSGAVKAQEATFKGMANGRSFMGSFPGRLPSDDLQQNPPQILVLHLIREGNILSGRIAAYCGGTSKVQYLYPFYIRLQRETAS
jgi:CubicO group peptidase (beta-lactamase class C family)